MDKLFSLLASICAAATIGATSWAAQHVANGAAIGFVAASCTLVTVYCGVCAVN